MDDAGTDPELSRTVGELARALQDLQRELEPGDRRRLRPPGPGELLRFTSDVAIPAAILILETNVRALKLLQRTLRMVEGRPARDRSSVSADVRERAGRVTSETLSRLDGALQDIGESLDAETHDEATDLLGEVRDLRAELDAQLDDQRAAADRSDVGSAPASSVDIDVESELQSIKDDVDDHDEAGADDEDGDPGDSGGRSDGDGYDDRE